MLQLSESTSRVDAVRLGAGAEPAATLTKNSQPGACPGGLDVKLKYARLIDKLAEIKGEIRNNLDLKTEELTKHHQQCTHAEAHYRGLMSTSVEQIAVYTVQPPRLGREIRMCGCGSGGVQAEPATTSTKLIDKLAEISL